MENKKSVKNITELAAILNLSVTTVSRVLNGKADDYRISPVTSKRVMDIANEMNYSPNKIARGLKMEKTETIGLIIPDIGNPFFSSMAKTIEIVARKNGFSLILCDSLDHTETEAELLNLMAGRKVDGIIMAPVGRSSTHIEEILKTGIPIVLVDRYFPNKGIPYITTDNYKGAFKAVDYIITQGHNRIACIQGNKDTTPNTDRLQGYMDALQKHNIPFEPNLVVGDNFGEENGFIQTRILMHRQNKPTAIFAFSNLISMGVLRALKETGLVIPNDVSLVSFDEQPYSAFLTSPMTTIKQQREEIASLAVNIILDMINNHKTEDDISIMIEPELIIRQSVKQLNA